VLGDLAAAADDENAGRYLPGLAPVAIQTGKYAAKMIESDITGRKRTPFHYNDKGSLATIGRNKAVGTIYGRHLTGYPAWMAWLFIHIFFLIGFRNRLLVLLEWPWTYFSVQRGARLITGDTS